MTTLASMSEIVRVGGWALRGAGFPFGVAERATRLLAFAEAAHGGAVRAVCAQEGAIALSRTAGAPARVREPDGAWRVDANGRHVLELGPPLADLACAAARRDGAGYARLEGVVGGVFASALADLLAQRGLTGLVASRDEGETGTNGGWALASGLGEGSGVLAGSLPGRPAAGAGQALQGEPLGRRIVADLDEAAKPGRSFLAILAISPDHHIADQFGAIGRSIRAAPGVSDVRKRVQDAYRDGVAMDFSELQALYDLEIRTWAPTSERSRSQAGYGKF